MKRIAIDMDGVMANVKPKFLDLYEQDYGIRLQPEQYLGKKIYQLPNVMEFRNHYFQKGFFRDLEVMENAVEVIKWLQEHYEVFITTAAMEFRNSFEDKYDWLAEHFPYLHWKNIVFCGNKSIINADYMIDDNAFNFEGFIGKGLLFTAFHNVEEKRYTRVDNWLEVKTFFEQELN